MYIYFDKNGTLKEIVADIPARRGSNDYNKIYVYLEGKTQDDISDIWYKQQFPDGTQSIEVSIKDNTVTKAIPYDKNVDLKFFQDYVEYPFYYINLNSSYLAQNGLNLGTIRVVIGDEIFALGMITFNVETNVVVKDTDISQSQYDYFITKMNTKVDKQSSDGDFQATISNEDGTINLESEEDGESVKINLEGSIGSMSAKYDVDHRGYIAFAGGNVSLYSLVGDYENEIIMNETEFYLQRKDKQDNLIIHKIDLVNGTIDGRAFNYSDVKRYQITNYTSGSTDYNFTQSGIDTNNLVAFRLVFNTVDANKELKINNKNVRLSTNPTSNATMGMLKSFKEDGANVYDFYAFYNGTYFYVINQNMYDKDVTMTHITLFGGLTGTLTTAVQQSISYNGIETLFNVTVYSSGALPILFRIYQVGSGSVYSYRSVTPLNDADGSYYYEGTINLNDGTYDLSTKVYITSGTNVSGTNDGKNWTSITIGDDTYDIPSGSGASSDGAYYELVTNDIAFYDNSGNQVATDVLTNLRITLSEGQFEALKEYVNPKLALLGIPSITDIDSLATMLNTAFTETSASASNLANLFFPLINGYCQFWTYVNPFYVGLVLANSGYGLQVDMESGTTYLYWHDYGSGDIPMGISATWTLSKYGTSGTTPSTESYYKVELTDYNLDSNIEIDLLLAIRKTDFDDTLTEINTQMGTNLQTPQDLMDFYDSVKGNSTYYGGCCLLFSGMALVCIQHNTNAVYIDYDVRGYNKITMASTSIPMIKSDSMVVVSALAPSNMTSITFTSNSTLTITETTNQDL